MRGRLLASILAAAVAASGRTSAASGPAPAASGPAERASSGAGGATVVVVVGAEGEPEFGRQFAAWADRWADAARRGGAKLVQVGRDNEQVAPAGAAPAPAPAAAPAPAPAPAQPESSADKLRLQSLLAQESAVDDPTRPLWLVLIGHGTHDGREAKFNLRGPDVSDAELAAWLKPFRRPLAVINCASSSAPFLNKLSAPGRVVVTATRSGTENNFARFGEHLSASVADPAADLDKDGQTSLLEAFLAASHKGGEFYKTESRLATEHALLDDNGDGLGIPADWFQGTRATRSAKDGAPLDGARARQWHLVLSDAEQALPAEMRAQRDRLELDVEALRARKATMPEADYYARLEGLLLQLARLYEQHPQPPTPVTPPKPAAPAATPAADAARATDAPPVPPAPTPTRPRDPSTDTTSGPAPAPPVTPPSPAPEGGR